MKTARGRWNVASGLKNRSQLSTLIAFFRARKGKAYGFRFKDWTDYQATAQAIGTADGATTAFQLVRTYTSGGVTETREIRKPVAGSVKVYKDAVKQLSGWTFDATTGIVTFSGPPSTDVVITVPLRYRRDGGQPAILQSGRLGRDPGGRAAPVIIERKSFALLSVLSFGIGGRSGPWGGPAGWPDVHSTCAGARSRLKRPRSIEPRRSTPSEARDFVAR